MPTFTQHLREKVAKSLLPQQPKNPLRTIGLSPLILELGLSDDELYEYCRDMARDLVVHFHPDRIGTAPTAVEHQRRFAGAFEALKDRQVFDGALSEFKQQHNDEMSERSAEAKIARSQRALLDETQTRLQGAEIFAKANNAKYERLRQKFFAHMKFRGAALSQTTAERLNTIGIQQATRLNLLVCEPYYPTSLPHRDTIRQYKERYAELVAQKSVDRDQIEAFRGSLNKARIGSTKVADLITKALDSDELFPEVNWAPSEGYRKLGFTRHISGGSTIRRRKPAIEPITNLSTTKLSGRYRSALTSIGSLMMQRAEGVETVSIRFESVEISRGAVQFNSHRYPILGSIRFDDVDPLRFRLLNTDLTDEAVLDHMRPLLVPGDLLVLQVHATVNKALSTEGRTADLDMQILHSADKELGSYSARCVILEAIPGDFD